MKKETWDFECWDGSVTTITEVHLEEGDYHAHFVEGDFGGNLEYLKAVWTARQYEILRKENPKWEPYILLVSIFCRMNRIRWDAGHK